MYLDMYEGVHADVVCTTRFDENPDLSTTYLGKTRMTRETKVKAEERFPISGQGYTLGELLDYTDCQILLDTGASKSYMSVILLDMQNITCIAEVCFQYVKNAGRKWSISGCTICNTSDSRYTWP